MAEQDYQSYCQWQQAKRGQTREYSSAEELAGYLNVTPETITLLTERAGLIPLQVANRSFYYCADVEKFFDIWAGWDVEHSNAED